MSRGEVAHMRVSGRGVVSDRISFPKSQEGFQGLPEGVCLILRGASVPQPPLCPVLCPVGGSCGCPSDGQSSCAGRASMGNNYLDNENERQSQEEPRCLLRRARGAWPRGRRQPGRTCCPARRCALLRSTCSTVLGPAGPPTSAGGCAGHLARYERRGTPPCLAAGSIHVRWHACCGVDK